MDLPKRKRIRLENYDYSQNGDYFITICTDNRMNLFGDIINGIMLFNEYGKIACDEIINTNGLRKRCGIQITKYIVMPNHIHMIIEIVGSRRAVTELPHEHGVGSRRAVTVTSQYEQFAMPTKQSIPTIIRAYKSAVTKQMHELDGHGRANGNNTPDKCYGPNDGHGTPCPYKIWQSRFHDHVIRNEQEYRRIWNYIDNNPLKWDEDCFYPNNINILSK